MLNQVTPIAKTGRYRAIDGLRGFAAGHIAFAHLLGLTANYHPTSARLFTPFTHGLVGVPLFLILCGFLLTHAELRQPEPEAYRSFIRRRWRRVALPYYAALGLRVLAVVAAAVLGMGAPTTGPLTPKQLVTHALFIHGFWPDTVMGFAYTLWVLSLIAQFYVAFPLLMAAARRWGPGRVFGVTLAASVAADVVIGNYLPRYNYLLSGVLPFRFVEFGTGMALAFAVRGRSFSWRSWIGPAVAALALAVWCKETGHYLWALFAFPAGYAALVLAVVAPDAASGWLGKALTRPWLVATGTVSYSLYLIHPVLFRTVLRGYAVFSHKGSVPTDLAFVAFTVLLAVPTVWVFYTLIEKRCLESARRKAPARPAVEQAKAEDSALMGRIRALDLEPAAVPVGT